MFENDLYISINKMQNGVVLLRTAFDIPDLQNLYRIKDTIPTIELLLQNQNKIIICSKWGRPQGVEEKLSFQKILPIIQKVFKQHQITEKLEYLDQYSSFQDVENKIQSSSAKLFILENLHFAKEEKSKNLEERRGWAGRYARLANYYVDEAFASSHRQEATNTEIKEILPWGYGLAYQNEISSLSDLKQNPTQPFTLIVGGAKPETKIPLIEKLLPACEQVLIGGLTALTFLEGKKMLGERVPDLGDSYIYQDLVPYAQKLVDENYDKILLPVDLVYEEIDGKKYARDLGTTTIALYQEIIDESETIFWNGPLGQSERPIFNQSTLEIAKFIIYLEDCYKVLAGGDTFAALPSEWFEYWNFVSMGGGATLDFLSS